MKCMYIENEHKAIWKVIKLMLAVDMVLSMVRLTRYNFFNHSNKLMSST